MENPFRDRLGVRDRLNLDECNKFVAAHSSNDVGPSEHTAQSLCDNEEQLIADEMAKGVVDGLESVQVLVEDRRHGFLFGARGEHEIDLIEDRGAIGEVRETVVHGEPAKLGGALLNHLDGAKAAGRQGVDKQCKQGGDE